MRRNAETSFVGGEDSNVQPADRHSATRTRNLRIQRTKRLRRLERNCTSFLPYPTKAASEGSASRVRIGQGTPLYFRYWTWKLRARFAPRGRTGISPRANVSALRTLRFGQTQQLSRRRQRSRPDQRCHSRARKSTRSSTPVGKNQKSQELRPSGTDLEQGFSATDRNRAIRDQAELPSRSRSRSRKCRERV